MVGFGSALPPGSPPVRPSSVGWAILSRWLILFDGLGSDSHFLLFSFRNELAELPEALFGFARQEHAIGEEAVSGAVAGGDVFAAGGFRAGRFFRILAVRGSLCFSGHSALVPDHRDSMGAPNFGGLETADFWVKWFVL